MADRTLRVPWLRLSDDGPFMLQVFDEAGDYIEGAIADDPQDAVLAVAERLVGEATSNPPE